MRKSLALAGIFLSTAGLLLGCNGGTTNNYNSTVSDCQLPTFNASIGNFMLTNWGNSVSTYSANNYPDTYTGAAYFTMSNYDSNAVLLPTVSPIMRVGTQAIYGYFTKFLQLNPQMSLPRPESIVYSSLGCGYGGANGDYDFVINPGTMQEATVQARFTFIYKYESQPYSENITVIGGPESGQVITQTNAPGWYIWTQNSAGLPE